jgi:predicted RNA-binding Zn-ribbon protein involved in translation (DUF1610 family)
MFPSSSHSGQPHREGGGTNLEPVLTMHSSITIDRIMEACERRSTSLDNPGFCIACGAEVEGVEPDACQYECEACGEHAVYGAEELLIMGNPLGGPSKLRRSSNT